MKKQTAHQVSQPGGPQAKFIQHPHFTTLTLVTQPQPDLLKLAAIWNLAASNFKSVGYYAQFELCRRRMLDVQAAWYAHRERTRS